MADINLLQTETSFSGNSGDRALRFLAKLFMFLLFVALAAYGFLLFTNWRSGQNLAKVKAQSDQKQAEAIASPERNELITRQAQLIELEKLADKHTYWSVLLPELARVTLKSAKYTTISADRDGQLNLTVTLPSYEELEKFMQIFDLPEYNKQFSNVKITSINKTQVGDSIETEVQLELTFNPEFILKNGT
jgi:hypothetical protein